MPAGPVRRIVSSQSYGLGGRHPCKGSKEKRHLIWGRDLLLSVYIVVKGIVLVYAPSLPPLVPDSRLQVHHTRKQSQAFFL